MYPEIMVIPMREELTRAGVSTKPAPPPRSTPPSPQPGTTMLIVNSICGLRGRQDAPRRPHGDAAHHQARPRRHRLRRPGPRSHREAPAAYFGGHPPTSPAIAILRDGQLVYLMQRSAIETSTAPAIAQELARAFDTYCAKTTA